MLPPVLNDTSNTRQQQQQQQAGGEPASDLLVQQAIDWPGNSTQLAEAPGAAASPWHCQLLDPAYALYWRTSAEHILVGLLIRGHQVGWAAVGLSEAGGMEGSDMLLAR
jgi:hypothetical protein